MNNAVKQSQTVLVLGGTSDIGRSIVEALVSPALRRVILAVRDPEQAEQAKQAKQAEHVGQGGAELAELVKGPLRDETIVVLSGGSLAGNADLRQIESGEWEIHGDPTEAVIGVYRYTAENRFMRIE